MEQAPVPWKDFTKAPRSKDGPAWWTYTRDDGIEVVVEAADPYWGDTKELGYTFSLIEQDDRRGGTLLYQIGSRFDHAPYGTRHPYRDCGRMEYLTLSDARGLAVSAANS